MAARTYNALISPRFVSFIRSLHSVSRGIDIWNDLYAIRIILTSEWLGIAESLRGSAKGWHGRRDQTDSRPA
jgi:hypothetical protein